MCLKATLFPEESSMKLMAITFGDIVVVLLASFGLRLLWSTSIASKLLYRSLLGGRVRPHARRLKEQVERTTSSR